MDKVSSRARFSIGEVVEHRLFGYRGVIIDVDPDFRGTDDWYETMALSQPPRDKPWYHVLPHGAEHQTYVAERNLEPDTSGQPVQHALLDAYFSSFSGGRYISDTLVN
jgi:heat shock protein HspQ